MVTEGNVGFILKFRYQDGCYGGSSLERNLKFFFLAIRAIKADRVHYLEMPES